MTQIDEILRDFLVASIADVKSDIGKVDQIFDGKSEEGRENIKQWLAGNDVKVIYHFPRDATDIPCYAIVLENSAESDQVIGSSGDVYDEILLSNMANGWVSSDSELLKSWIVDSTSMSIWETNHYYAVGTTILPSVSNGYYYVCSYSGVSGSTEPDWYFTGKVNPDGSTSWIGKDLYLGRPVDEGSINVRETKESKDGRSCCHVVADTGSLNKGIKIDFESSVLEGGYVSLVGMGYVTLWVKSNRIGTFLQFGFGENGHEEQVFDIPITTKGYWEKVRIDIRKVADRNKDKIRYMSFMITNASADIDIYIGSLRGEKSSYLTYDEVYFDHKYRAECWSNNVEVTLILYEIARWYVLKERTYLQNTWGLVRQQVDGGDIVPQPEYYPEFVYIRSLGYSCSTIELIPREEDLSDIDVKVGRTDFGQ